MMTVIPLLIAAFVKMTPLETFHDGTNDTLAAAKAYTDSHRGVDTNVVRNLINASFDGGTQEVNRVTASFDGLGNRVTEIERELPGISNRVDTLETATNTLQTTVTSHTSQLSQLSQSVATKQDKLTDYTTTNAVKAIVESEVGGTNTIVHGTKVDETDIYNISVMSAERTTTANRADIADAIYNDYWQTGDHPTTLSGYGIADAYDKDEVNNMLDGLVTASEATNITHDAVSPVSNKVDYLEGYVAGQRIRVSVTNYYGNTSGDLPRLRIEEFVTATNTADGVSTETNYWQVVWDEQNKYDRFMSEATTAIAAMTNNLYQTYYSLLQERLATKAPRAWGTLTSAGEAAPPGTVWQTEPNTVFAGGTEYAHAMVGTGVIGVLQSKGAAAYTDGETGRFHFTTDDKTAFFGMNIATRYELGCATDGITVTAVGGNNMVDLLYNVTMTGKPILYYKTNLVQNAWEQITDSSGGSIPGATVYASWDQSPPAGSEICTINCGAGISGFFKASIEYAGTSKFETNMMADLAGGIVATNQTSNQVQPVEPYISNGNVMWRIKQ